MTIVAAWILGWIVYMIAMMMTVYNGLLSLIFQPIMGALTSTIFVGEALLVGLIFRIPVIGKAWTSSRWWDALLAVEAYWFCALVPLLASAPYIQTRKRAVTLQGYTRSPRWLATSC
jgi:hypothetical protein